MTETNRKTNRTTKRQTTQRSVRGVAAQRQARGQKSNKGEKKESPLKLVTNFAMDSVELFRDLSGTPYCRVYTTGHREILAIESDEFLDWLVDAYDEAESASRSIPISVFKNAQDFLARKARRNTKSKKDPVFTRVAEKGDVIYIDLGDEYRRCVRIDKEGWKVIYDPPVNFRRASDMDVLPVPKENGDINLLRKYTRFSDADFALAVGWLVGSLSTVCEYCHLMMSGEKGTTKSFTAKLFTWLLDPRDGELQLMPKDSYTLSIMARDCYVLVSDNVTYISDEAANRYCGFSTGTGETVRTYYTTGMRTKYREKRPVIISAIGNVVRRGDMLDRILQIDLLPLAETGESYKPQADLEREFLEDRPYILGWLYDAVSVALRNCEKARKAPNLPRLATFTSFVHGAGMDIPLLENFLDLFREQQSGHSEISLDDSLIVIPLKRLLLEQRPEEAYILSWYGRVSELFVELERIEKNYGNDNRKSLQWPKSPNRLGDELKGLAPALRKQGIFVRYHKRKESGQPIQIEWDWRKTPQDEDDPYYKRLKEIVEATFAKMAKEIEEAQKARAAKAADGQSGQSLLDEMERLISEEG